MNGDRPHILALDALRGVAAMAVLLIHIGYIGGDRSLARFGYLAVDLFFVLSGYVIGRAYEDKLLTGMSWQRFMLLRVARLYPSLFLAVVVGLVAHFVVPGGTYRLGWYSIGHLFLAPDLTAPEGIFPLNGVLWTLFFELAINLVHGLVVRRLTNVRLGVFVVVMAACWAYVGLSSGNWGGGWNGATFAGGLARVGWGYGTGLLMHRLMRARWKVPAIVPVALAGAVFLWPTFGMLTARITISLFVLMPLTVALAVASEVPAPGRGVARWLGAISYPLYAIHHPLLLMTAQYVDFATGGRWLLLAVAIVTLATVVEYAYDAPLRKRLLAHVASTSTPTSGTPAGRVP